MVDSNELQRLARLVDMNKQRLDEINQQIERIEAVQLEHDDTRRALSALSGGKSGHITLGAGVMVPIPSNATTIVDLGSGVFGERSPDSAKELVSKRLEDLTELKSQFEADAAMLTQRIEELATTFEKAAQAMTESNQETEVETPKPEEKPSKRKRRGFGGELTLDD
ncbi:MAG: prefoldin subunit alpha [Candidatus Poseidoniaceae archaeon]